MPQNTEKSNLNGSVSASTTILASGNDLDLLASDSEEAKETSERDVIDETLNTLLLRDKNTKKAQECREKVIAELDSYPEHFVLTPVGSPKKDPKAAYFKNWASEEPVSRERIKGELQNKKASGVGLRTGSVSGFLLDIDVDGIRAEEKLLELFNGEIPKTVSYTSGKPGRFHLLFVVPERYRDKIKYFNNFILPCEGKDSDGKSQQIELRYNKHQSVLPPSFHPETGEYKWINSPQDCEIAEAPSWIFDLYAEYTSASTKPKDNFNQFKLSEFEAFQQSGKSGFNIHDYKPYLEEAEGKQGYYICPLCNENNFWINPNGQQYSCYGSTCENDAKANSKIASILVKKKNSLQQQIDANSENETKQKDLFEVTKSVEETVLVSFFDDGNGDIISMDSAFYKYNPEKGAWDAQSEENIKQQISEHLRKLYKTQGKKETKKYTFATSSNLNNSLNYCQANLYRKPKDTSHLLAFSNCTLNLRTGERLPHNKDNFLTFSLDAKYRPNCECPDVLKNFIIDSYGEEYLELIRAITSMLLDPDAPYGYFPLLIGQSGGGKGVLLRFWKSLFSQSNVKTLANFSLVSEPEKRHQFLTGAKIVCFPDLGGFQKTLRDFYELVDNGGMSGRALFAKHSYEKIWNVRFIAACVDMLPLENSGDGWMRRCIPIGVRSRKVNPDFHLGDKLSEVRSEAISWAMSMDVERRNELLKNSSQIEAVANLKREQSIYTDSVRAFVDKCLRPTDSGETMNNTDLHTLFVSFCEKFGFAPSSEPKFVAHLKTIIPQHRVDSTQPYAKPGEKRIRIPAHWRNIELLKGTFDTQQMHNAIVGCHKNKCIEGGLIEFEEFALQQLEVKAKEESTKENSQVDGSKDDKIEIGDIVCHYKEDATNGDRPYGRVAQLSSDDSKVLVILEDGSEEFITSPIKASPEDLSKDNIAVDSFALPPVDKYVVIRPFDHISGTEGKEVKALVKEHLKGSFTYISLDNKVSPRTHNLGWRLMTLEEEINLQPYEKLK